MSDEIERLLVRVEANAVAFEGQMKKVNRALYGSSAETRKTLDRIKRDTAAAAPQMFGAIGTSFKREIASLAPMLAGLFSAQQVIKYADAYTSLQNRLKATGLEGAALKKVEDGLYAAANRNGVAVSATAELYQRASMARQNLGASEEQLMQIVSGTSAALKLQGTSAGEASGALLQLGQLLGGNMVQSQEYNSLIDGLPTLLEAVAKGSDRWGGSINKLTKDVKAGKVSAQDFSQAMLKGFADIEARAGKSTTTVGAALQTLNNQLGRFIGQTDSSLSATARMAQAIEWLANNLDTVTKLVGALAAVVGTRFVLAMTAGSGAMIANTVASARLILFQTAMTASMTGTTRAAMLSTAAMRSFGAAIAANPIGAAIVAVAALAAGITFLATKSREASEAQKELGRRTGELDEANGLLEDAINKVASAQGKARKTAIEEANALVVLTRKKIEDAEASLDAAEAELALARARAQSYAEAQRQTGAVSARGDIGESGAFGGAGYVQSGFDQAVARSEAAFEKGQSEIARLREKQAKLVKQLENPDALRAPGGGDDDPKKPKKSTGPTPEELAAQRQMLDLQGEIELLRAQGRTAEADAKQDQVDALGLTKQYEEAGFANAKAKAEQHVKALATAREANRAAEEAERLAEGEQRAAQLTRNFMLEMLDVQDQLALTDRDALDVRRQILAIRQAERRVALEAAAADADATEAERAAARGALADLPKLERGESRALEGSTEGAREAKGIVADLRAPESAVERAREAYEEIDRLRQDDVISEQEAALAKAQIDADLREQRLAGTQTMLGALATLQNSSNKKLAALGKAAAIAQATIDGVLAVQKALASAPPPMNFIQAAVVGAVAAANVASIAGMADGGLVTGPGGPREDKVLRRLSAGEFVVNAKATGQNRALLEALNSGKVPRLANGGLVGRANAAAASLGSARAGSSSSFSYAPTIDARGADLAAVQRLERIMEDERANFAANVNGVREKRARYKLGSRRP